MQLSPSDFSLITDTKHHYSDLFLAIYSPKIVMKCRINKPSIQRGEMVIPYDSVSYGSFTQVKPGSTLLVGTYDGGRDVGKVRIRSITSSSIRVAENSHIKWQDNLYLTIIDFFDIWPVYPRIIQDPNNPEKTLWYKDYDISYSNQNEIYGAFVDIGPHRAGILKNGQVQFYWTLSGTLPLTGSIASISWEFEGGSPSTSNLFEPGYVQYTNPGNYLTRCQVTGTTGWTETVYRYVRVDSSPQFKKWEIQNFQGSRSEGGYSATIKIYEDVPDINDGDVVILFANEFYDDTNKSLGGNAVNASDIKFVGYILDGSIEYDYKESSVSFNVGSITDVLKNMEGFAVSIEDKANPQDWYELKNMNAKRALYHYLKWHSTVLQTVSLQFTNFQDCPVQYFDSDRESIFDAVDNFIRSAYHGSIVADRQGKMWVETDAYILPETFSPTFTLERKHWIDSPKIDERVFPEISYLEYGGVAYTGPNGTYAPLMACAPGNAPGYRGKVERKQGLALISQSQLNSMVGNAYAFSNFRFPTIDITMRGNWSNLDIAPQESILVNILPSDTIRNVSLNHQYTIENITWTFDASQKLLYPRIVLTPITSGDAGETIPVPPSPNDGGGSNLPPLPDIPPYPSSFTTGKFIQVQANITHIPGNDPVNKIFVPDMSIINQNSSGYTISQCTIWPPNYTIVPMDIYGNVHNDYYHGITIPYDGFYRISFEGTVAVSNNVLLEYGSGGILVLANGSIASNSTLHLPYISKEIANSTSSTVYTIYDLINGCSVTISYLTAGTKLSVGFFANIALGTGYYSIITKLIIESL
jgi:hypothetical protein